jgi:hypothetical protein
MIDVIMLFLGVPLAALWFAILFIYALDGARRVMHEWRKVREEGK